MYTYKHITYTYIYILLRRAVCPDHALAGANGKKRVGNRQRERACVCKYYISYIIYIYTYIYTLSPHRNGVSETGCVPKATRLRGPRVGMEEEAMLPAVVVGEGGICVCVSCVCVRACVCVCESIGKSINIPSLIYKSIYLQRVRHQVPVPQPHQQVVSPTPPTIHIYIYYIYIHTYSIYTQIYKYILKYTLSPYFKDLPVGGKTPSVHRPAPPASSHAPPAWRGGRSGPVVFNLKGWM